ncbi:MAG: hypothetical protein KF871_16340 [Hydrogenophaga sp.]|uniref:chondroitinase-B domain-containing protein n=1 Tax=Hydrogenophaga sp. TaxID=1904254 RepID=UPI001D7A25F6|nr:chondroitinase-B domain-containing protein [Hydrogenophaga sp.]MBX3611463.1 hypothetical protein [Hydrogenophaga sp.]
MKYTLVGLLMLGLGVGIWLFSSERGQHLVQTATGHGQRDLVRHALRRLQGHPSLELAAVPVLHWWQRQIERDPPAESLPALGKGQQPQALPPIHATGEHRLVVSEIALAQALREAQAGATIEIAPGRYAFDTTLRLGHGGTAREPITLRAQQPGTAWLAFKQVEGVLVDKPHWVFENLQIEGTCARDDDCEHAFHVVGDAHHTVIRNNALRNFNAAVKVNGHQGVWPDHGLLAHNTLVNDRPRVTANPVVMFDLVGADAWVIEDNLVGNFVKQAGNGVSYGLFVKGGSEGARIERNLVVCTPRDISQPGVRVGISFGGGRTGAAACRRDGCREHEHRLGLAANNIVAHCNDSGLDLNHALDINLVHNTLINTGGISARDGSSARSAANLIENGPYLRDASNVQSEHDVPLAAVLATVDADRLRWRPTSSTAVPSQVATDFKGRQRPAASSPGAIDFRD